MTFYETAQILIALIGAITGIASSYSTTLSKYKREKAILTFQTVDYF